MQEEKILTEQIMLFHRYRFKTEFQFFKANFFVQFMSTDDDHLDSKHDNSVSKYTGLVIIIIIN